ncbi:HTH-type transcriptional repressor NicR [Streptomyces hundungensis]|uniref:HTH-type transcriptional repressor NicR n=1 Tax=Streptomyces hundungensis TaxID=1077946 RepID=A0A387H7L3_9ACTN|nr:HTH-type transcriptional repressor NicR [Streptomyces hundungensis]
MTRQPRKAESALTRDADRPTPAPAEPTDLAALGKAATAGAPSVSAPRPAPDALPALQRIQALPSWLVGRVAARGRSLVAEALAGQGVKMLHHAVLAAVSEFGPVAQADLGRKLAIDPKDLVGVLNDLQADGLTLREPDPRDRRKNAVTVTPAGRDLLERCATVAEAANAELLAPLTPAEARRLIALLTRLHEA